jgi:hypothetical protein
MVIGWVATVLKRPFVSSISLINAEREARGLQKLLLDVITDGN